MPTWNELLNEFDAAPTDADKLRWLNDKPTDALECVRRKRADRNVILYASAFLQKPTASPLQLQLTHEEINGFMSIMSGLDCAKGADPYPPYDRWHHQCGRDHRELPAFQVP
jgi:hypothetical protein